MRRILILSGLVVIAPVLSFADSFSGRLVDAACASQQRGSTCNPTSKTTSFALELNGKMLRLDAAGNRKAADALQGSDNSADRDQKVNATVEGTLNGSEIKVDTIEIQ